MSGRQLRMSDITKSNDYNEVYMFFPGIIDAMRDEYYKNPFPFEFDGKTNEIGMSMLSNWHMIILELNLTRVELLILLFVFVRKVTS